MGDWGGRCSRNLDAGAIPTRYKVHEPLNHAEAAARAIALAGRDLHRILVDDELVLLRLRIVVEIDAQILRQQLLAVLGQEKEDVEDGAILVRLAAIG